MNDKFRKLSREEERIIGHKGTEAPFSGEYCNCIESGIYCCRRCGAALYLSGSKFDSGCGWPAFDDEIRGAVRRRPDPDGRRTEITCAACDGHLGHVFSGEQMTDKNIRHCVNSLSIRLVTEDSLGVAVFAGGCFWGVEEHFLKTRGVMLTRSGFTGGSVEKPTYEMVCGGETGHFEAVEVTYDRSETNYENLLKLFFQIHDFTQIDGQGPDIGSQYQSALFVRDPEQKKCAESTVQELEKMGYSVATKILPASEFWPAEEYHQKYYAKNGQKPYCHVFRKIWQ